MRYLSLEEVISLHSLLIAQCRRAATKYFFQDEPFNKPAEQAEA
jgi:hypothetical protein